MSLYRGIGSVLLVSSIVLAIGCSSKGNDFYKHQPSLPPLEVPPDLTLLSIDSGFEIPQVAAVERKVVVLPDGSNVSLEKDGQLRWLKIDASPDDVWDEIRSYWISNKVPLDWQNIKLGLMETEWIENYDSEFVKDRFRTRIETSDGGKTSELYLSHRGMQEDVVEGEMVRGWTDKINDPEVEVEVLGDLLLYLGLNAELKDSLLANVRKKAKTSRLVTDSDIPHILMKESVDRSWKFTLQAIDRMGYVVTLKDKDNGWIDVRVSENGETSDFVPGFSLSNSDRSIYRIQLRAEGEQTEVSILSDEGQPDRTEAARAYLEKLHGFL